MDDMLNDILRAADRHPNSKVSKLIREVEDQPSQKNIVMLLIELSDHAEYATDFNISLRYYLNMFERLGINRELMLNEAGLLLVNSSKIYSKRVDYVQSMVERQIMTLSNADNELQKENEQQNAKETKTTPAEKPKRGRKRALDAPTDPYEVQLEPKKFKKMTQEKRFAPLKTQTKAKPIFRNIEMEQQIHPAGWKYATIYDLENEEDVDTKRNYKLFTYHIERRYNTLVSDINFRLYFKVKDFMDAQEEEMDDMDDATHCNDHSDWPEYSEEYVQKYINLENKVLQQEIDPTMPYVSPKINVTLPRISMNLQEKDSITALTTCLETSVQAVITETDNNVLNINDVNTSVADNSLSINDSGLGTSDFESTLNTTTQLDTTQAGNSTMLELEKQQDSTNISYATQENDTSILDSTSTSLANTTAISSLDNSSLSTEINNSINCSQTQPENDTGLGESLLDQTNNANETTTETQMDSIQNNSADTQDSKDKENNEVNTNSSTEQTSITDGQETTKPEDGKTTENKCLENPILSADNQQNTESTEQQKKDSIIEDKLTTKEKSDSNVDTFQVQIEVLNDEGKAESKTVQIQISNDEGCHLSEAFEANARLPTSTEKNLNIMGDIERKDIKIIMDKELREALELGENMPDHFFQETYKVPVSVEPKEYPLLFNILQLPPKLFKRKCLFKLGPDMDLIIKARKQKPVKPPKEPRQNRLIQIFPLKNTDMSGIVETPPRSPGKESVFLGFTDDEISCEDFCGFNEDELNKPVDRLSLDSGVDDLLNTLPASIRNILDAEMNTENVIDVKNVSELNSEAVQGNNSILGMDEQNKNLCTKLENENNVESEGNNKTVEALLSTLPSSIRNILDNEINADGEGNVTVGQNANEAVESNLDCEKESASNKVQENNVESQSNKPSENEPSAENTTANENSDQINSTNENSDKANEMQVNNVESQLNQLPENTTSAETSAGNENSGQINSNNENSDKSIEPTISTENVEVSVINDGDNDCDSRSSFDNNNLFDLDVQGGKTKIQQWHEHLRPILAKSRERHHFDVFQLGTEIINTIQSEDDVESVEAEEPIVATFGDIMENKDKSYVSRYFLSTLLLANQSNINISVKNKTSEEPSAWSDIELKLLSTKRHTVAIEDNIGMINDKKRKKSQEDESHPRAKIKTKRKSSPTNQSSNKNDETDSEDSDEPLSSFQFHKNANKRLAPIGNLNEIHSKRLLLDLTSASKDNSNIVLTATDDRCLSPATTITPSTSKQQVNFLLNSPKNHKVQLNEIRVLQPITQLAKPAGDDLDSGIFSVGEISTS